MPKLLQLTDNDGFIVCINPDHVSTVESPKIRDSYGKCRKDSGSLIMMVNTQRISVQQSPSVVAELLNDLQ